MKLAEQHMPHKQDDRSAEEIEHAVLSVKNGKLEENSAAMLSSYLDPVKQELLKEEIPLPISPVLPPLINNVIEAADINLATLFSTTEIRAELSALDWKGHWYSSGGVEMVCRAVETYATHHGIRPR